MKKFHEGQIALLEKDLSSTQANIANFEAQRINHQQLATKIIGKIEAHEESLKKINELEPK